MGKLYNPVLSEEQLAAYLDGMLSAEENEMVENITISDPIMEEIFDVVDDVDTDLIIESDIEIPIECLADDFILPGLDSDYQELSNEDFNDDQLNDEYQEESSANDFNSDDSSFLSQDDYSIDDIV